MIFRARSLPLVFQRFGLHIKWIHHISVIYPDFENQQVWVVYFPCFELYKLLFDYLLYKGSSMIAICTPLKKLDCYISDPPNCSILFKVDSEFKQLDPLNQDFSA